MALSDAVVVIDKPIGLTSFDVVAQVRRACGIRRVGHAGTLDPLASGILVICLGEATKLVPYLMDADKVYRATARLGVATDTDDADPQARQLFIADAESLRALRKEQVQAALAELIGDIVQRPPRFSALKHQGQRLYAKARAQRGEGLPAESDAEAEALLSAKQRPVRVDAIDVESIDLAAEEPSVTFTVRCGKGTYIRSLARDLGERLGVGAHLSALRRLRVGRFDESCAVAPAEIAQARRFDLVEALRIAEVAQAQVELPLARRVKQGQVSALTELGASFPPTAAPLCVVDTDGVLMAIVEKADAEGRWRIARGF